MQGVAAQTGFVASRFSIACRMHFIYASSVAGLTPVEPLGVAVDGFCLRGAREAAW